MAYRAIVCEISEGVGMVTLNRPDKLNAWTREMDREVREAMAELGTDGRVRAIVLTGAGRGFCAGADMTMLSGIQAGGADAGEAAKPRPDLPFTREARADWRMTYSYFPAVPKPVIAAINGPCAGLGLVIALYCDLRFAAQSAVFTTAFAARGLIAEHGISWLLPRLVGPANAMDLMVSARKVSAEEAGRIGLVNRVVADSELMGAATGYARTLATTVSPRSTAVMKRQLWEAQFQTLAEATVIGDREMERSFASEDFKEGVAHFLERRAPRFSGR